MKSAGNMHEHFTEVASSYNIVRTTDLDPVLHIKKTTGHMKSPKALDIGCGSGRYDLLLFEHLDNFHLTCVDFNRAMVEKVSDYLHKHGITNFKAVQSSVEELSLDPGSFDFILTFNAIHHFDFKGFLKKASVLLKQGGLIFIYTRLQSQNRKSIWGKYFPSFIDRETRLYEMEDMKMWVESVESVNLESVDYFRFRRQSTLEHLLNQARNKHYSTFSLYTGKEFESALRTFKKSLARDFDDLNNIQWHDENIMLTLRHSG